MNIDRFVEVWGHDLISRGLLNSPTKDYLETLLIHFMNMGGLDIDDIDDAMKYVNDDALFNELVSRLKVRKELGV